MTSAKKLSDQITKAMEGVTPGPWHIDPKAAEESFFEDVNILRHDGLAVAVCVHNGDIMPPEPAKNAAYIAATQPDNMRVILSALADAELQSTADSRIAELEQQIANIKASRDLQVTIAADEEERARKAEAQRETYEEILRVVCGHLELPQSESGPADDLSLYDRALEQADVMYRQTEAERVGHMNARYSAEAKLIGENRRFSVLIESKDETIRQLNEEAKYLRAKLAEAVKVIADLVNGLVTDDDEGLIEHVPQIVSARAFLSKLEASHAV
ncbi:hypothetical protein [Rhizobium sp. RCC_161_2]|uniref:hypothetical protein n=1 Tax=Rhizobium sp. RCC_161_2 TaxID=3239219 RepID=UPI0035259415